MHETVFATRLFVEHKSETAELAAVSQAGRNLKTVLVVWPSFPTMQSGEGTHVITAQVLSLIKSRNLQCLLPTHCGVYAHSQ